MTETRPLPRWSGPQGRRVLVLTSSPRLEGNSHKLAEALAAGAQGAGAEVHLVDLALHVTGLLRDCRSCRRADGSCSIEDGHGEIFRELYLSADVVVYATPIWWYGISGTLKAFVDRIFCFMGEQAPGAAGAVQRLQGKRMALLLSAEESNFAARLAIVEQMCELGRYLHHDFVGIVTGVGNRRGEVASDPANPIAAARELGARLLAAHGTDYQIETERPKTVWGPGTASYPATWR